MQSNRSSSKACKVCGKDTQGEVCSSCVSVDLLTQLAIEKAGSLDKYLAKIEAKYPKQMLDYPTYHVLKQRQEDARVVKASKPHEHLKLWRKKAKFTQQEVADMLGVSKQMVCQVEKGIKPMPREWLELFSSG